MATTASRFFPVATKEPFLNQGWIIKVRDWRDMNTLVAIMVEFSGFSFTQELNGAGTGNITLDKDSPFWTRTLANGAPVTDLIEHEYVYEAWENGACRFAWFGQARNTTVATEDETRPIEISGPGIAHVLTRAIINRPGWPQRPPIVDYQEPEKYGQKYPIRRSNSASDLVPAFIWQFPVKWSTMRMWHTVFKAAQRRGVLGNVKPQFDATKDSDGKIWKYVDTIDQIVDKHGFQPPQLDENLLDFLNDCTGQDPGKWFAQRTEWIMQPGFKLYVRETVGVDRSRSVRFFGGHILGDQFSRDSSEVYNRIIAVDVEGGESNRTSKYSINLWGLREKREETNKNVTNPALRDKLADTYLAKTRNEISERTLRIPYDTPGRHPFRDFQVGDWISFNDSKMGSANGPIKRRVLAITISVTADQAVPDVELTLQSLRENRLLQLERKLTRLINKPEVVDLDGLGDVDTGGSTEDGNKGLVYDPKTGKWVPKSGSTGNSGGSSGIGSIYVQKTNPALDTNNTIKAGDVWLETYD